MTVSYEGGIPSGPFEQEYSNDHSKHKKLFALNMLLRERKEREREREERE